MSWLKKAAGGSVTGRVVGSCGCQSCPVSPREGSRGRPGRRRGGTGGGAEGCTQVIRKSPCGRGYPEIQANKVVRTPYLCSASPPGHGSACPGVSAGRGNTEPLRSKLCFLFKKQDLAIVQPAGASCV